MNINQMHITFRNLGQQMGLQRIRAILPESIDIYLNDAITEWVRKRIIANVDTVYNDRVTIQRNDVNPINGIRTLYKEAKIAVGNLGDNNNYLIDLSVVGNIMFYTSFDVKYKGGNSYYGCRFVERDKVAATLRDYCNSASREYPIICMFSNDRDAEIADLYIGDNTEPETLNVKYIANPDKVIYNIDPTLSIDCNLPEYSHYEIVELAVNKFFSSVGATNQTVSNQ